mgnify:FL=1
MHDTPPAVQRHIMPPTTLERYLTKLANVDMPYQTVYIEPGAKLKSFLSVLPSLPPILDISPVLSSINDGDVGAVLFWDTEKLRIVLPPLPITRQSLSVGLDTGPLLALLRTEPIIGVCLVRLGRFGIGVYQGSTLLNSRTDRRFVKGRHKKGGSSSNRFRRIREKQADELYKKVCTILQQQFGPYEGKMNHLFLGGESSTLVGFASRCAYLKNFDGIARSRVLNVREPGHEALQKLPRTLWESVVYEVQVSLCG